MLLVCLTPLSIVSCAVSDGCAWTRPFVPDTGFEARWTLSEKRQAVAHNRAWAEFCR